MALTALVVVTALCVPLPLHANTIEDLLGVGARNKAMGGAGTAAATDFAAVFYNPASLSFCPGNSVSIGWGHIDHNLSINDDQSFTGPEPQEPRDLVSIGFCVQMPLDFSFGILIGLGLQKPMVLSQQSIDPLPRFIMHDERLDGLSIMLGPSYRMFDQLSFGAAISVLANSTLNLENTVPVATTAEVRNDLQWNLAPTAAVYVGAHYQIFVGLDVGLVYRSALFHDLNVTAKTQVDLSGLLLDVDLILQSAMWYSPQQVAVGAAYAPAPIPGLIVSADLTWYNWGAYPGAFIIATPHPDSAVAQTLNFPEREPPGFSDIMVPRFGAEYVWNEMVAGRIGYSFRPSPAPVPTGLANLLDADTHVFSIGAGFRWSFAASAGENESESENESENNTESSDESNIESSNESKNESESSNGSVSDSESSVGIGIGSISIDGYLTIGLLSDRVVDKGGTQAELNDYSFGGLFIDAGLMASIEY